jgi:hypothetical protein
MSLEGSSVMASRGVPLGRATRSHIARSLSWINVHVQMNLFVRQLDPLGRREQGAAAALSEKQVSLQLRSSVQCLAKQECPAD